MKETSNDVVDALARYIHSNWIVYESLVAYVRGDQPLNDASNARIRELQEAQASFEYVSFWRHRYEAAYAFFRSKPLAKKPEFGRLLAAANFPYPERHAAKHADEDAFNLFGKDPVAEHRAKRQLETMRAAASRQLKIDEAQISALRKAWKAERAQRQDSFIDNFSKTLRVSNLFNVVRQDPDAAIRISDLSI